MWIAIGVAAMVVTAACGGGDGVKSEAGVARPADARPTTTAAPAVSEDPEGTPTEPAPATTAPAGVTGTTAVLPEPVLVDGIPQVRATPPRAPAGTRVQLEGYGFVGNWQRQPASLWLSDGADHGECGVLAEADHDLRLSDDGHLVGSFVVPEKGICRFSSGAVVKIAAGTFDITFRCSTDCRVGTFTVILPGESMEEPTGPRCDQTVDFGGGENIAGDIYAAGLPCEAAEAFLRAHAGPLGPVNGPAHIDDGFSCDRTGASDVHLPRANYKCTRGSQSIWFIRT